MLTGRGLPAFAMPAAAFVLASCAATGGTAPASSAVPSSATQRATPAGITATQAAAPSAQPPPASWADVFPAGPGKEVVLQRCGTCHGFDRIVLGQKPAARWDASKESHKDKVSGMSDADLSMLYGYLAQSFGPDRPEPNIIGLPTTGSAE